MAERIERRKAFRLPIITKAICRVDKNTFEGKIRDVSLVGLFMETAECPPAGSKCNIEIVIPGKYSCLKIEQIKGVIVRRNEYGIGIQFDNRLEWIALIPIYFHKLHNEII